jgi:predicted Zn-dependent peptidase
MRLYLTLFVALLCSEAFAQSGIKDEAGTKKDSLLLAHMDIIDRQVIPEDTSVRTGVLKNGLTYYVRRNTEPKGKAYLRLLVRAGSVLEEDNEQGLAHFVEHMMFWGTKYFPGQQGVTGFMQRSGIDCAHDSNAHTGFNSTHYIFDDIPTNPLLLDSCLMLLRDWAGYASFTDENVESERNAIVEEWRSRNINTFGLSLLPDLLSNSFYSRRLPIGDMEVIKNCSPKLVRGFYERWYQPQNQAVVVVGDFDPDKMVARIQKQFSKLKRGKNIPPARPQVHDTETSGIRLYQSQNLFAHSSILYIRVPEIQADNTIGSLRPELVLGQLKDYMKNRLNRLNKNVALNSSVNYNTPLDLYDERYISIELSSTPDQWQQTLERQLIIMEETRRFGCSKYDLDSHDYTSPAYNEDTTAIILPDTTFRATIQKDSKEWADRYFNCFFNGAANNDYFSEYAVKNYIKNTITKEQLEKTYRELFSGRNMIVAEMFPAGMNLPSEDEVSRIISRVSNMTDVEILEKILEMLSDIDYGLEPLNIDSVKLELTPGTIEKATVRNDSITELHLSNGVKVLLWKSQVKEGKYCIDMQFGRPLGYASLRDDAMLYSSLFEDCRRKFKDGSRWNDVEFNKYNDRLFVNAYATDLSEDFWKYVERRLKMIHAALTTTEVDSVEATRKIRQLKSGVTLFNTPFSQAKQRIRNLPMVQSRRNAFATPEDVADYSVDGFREVVREYLSNFNGSTLIIKGQFDTDTITPLVLKYIGSLPSKPEPVRRTVWPSDHFQTTDTVVVEKITSTTPYSSIHMFYTWEDGFRFTQETHAHNEVLESVLDALLYNRLRSQHSDVYTPSCGVEDMPLPVHRMMCTITFICDPTQRERIVENVDQLLHEMADGNLITQDLIDSYIKIRRKDLEETNWGSQYFDLTREMGDMVIDKHNLSYIEKVTPASLRAHLRQLLQKGNRRIGYLTTE